MGFLRRLTVTTLLFAPGLGGLGFLIGSMTFDRFGARGYSVYFLPILFVLVGLVGVGTQTILTPMLAARLAQTNQLRAYRGRLIGGLLLWAVIVGLEVWLIESFRRSTGS